MVLVLGTCKCNLPFIFAVGNTSYIATEKDYENTDVRRLASTGRPQKTLFMLSRRLKLA